MMINATQRVEHPQPFGRFFLVLLSFLVFSDFLASFEQGVKCTKVGITSLRV